jgi:hypothetical protein
LQEEYLSTERKYRKKCRQEEKNNLEAKSRKTRRSEKGNIHRERKDRDEKFNIPEDGSEHACAQ